MRPPGRLSLHRHRAIGAAALSSVTLLGAVLIGGCGSAHQSVASSTTNPPGPPTTAGPPTTPSTAATLPTVPNCGAGAYKPARLLIVCGDATTMATGVSWSSWDATTATGTGTVHLVTGAVTRTAPARLVLSQVTAGSGGLHFTLLTVTWSGTSPDGHPTDTFHLAVVG